MTIAKQVTKRQNLAKTDSYDQVTLLDYPGRLTF